MRTNGLNKICTIMAAIIILSASCKKDETGPSAPVSKTPGATSLSQPVSSGAIVDYGMLNNDVRTMRTVIDANSFVLTDSIAAATLSGVTAEIAVSFYTTDDMVIPSGVYTFTNSDSKVPFTFDTADLVKAADSATRTLLSDIITGGKIIVSQDGTSYKFDISVSLSTGKSLVAAYSGPVTYTDSDN